MFRNRTELCGIGENFRKGAQILHFNLVQFENFLVKGKSPQTGSYEKSEDQCRLDKREGPNGTATSYLAVIYACVCRNEPHHGRTDGRTEQRYV